LLAAGVATCEGPARQRKLLTSLLQGIFNFRPAVRPVPLEAHIQGYPGKFYCPRMATMNKPTYAAIQSYSPNKPVLVFVSSRRQTRLTALDIIAFAAADLRPSQWLHMSAAALEETLALTNDANLRHTLQFGVGLHHAGLSERDRELVERLFCKQHIQVLVATSTLAWGVNTPAHLVIIKGTEYFDARSRRCVAFNATACIGHDHHAAPWDHACKKTCTC
jgi:activating signal cointegrator complex subunit 3